MNERYEIGQIRKLEEDLTCTSELTGDVVKTYKKGTEMVVSANGFFVFPDGRMIQLPKDAELRGYDTTAIAHRIMKYLKHDTQINDVIDDEDDYCSEKSYREVIEEALYDVL